MRHAEKSFGDRLEETFDSAGQLCLGIDPHTALLDQWGLENSADGVLEFGLRVVDAAAGRIGIVKPQVAFFESHGAAGYAALEQVIGAARSAGLLVIADAKRGDVGSTMEAYAECWLTPGSSLEADALTVNPYLGIGALSGTIDLALSKGKGLFVLAATSNPEASRLQTAMMRSKAGELTVAASIVDDVNDLNRRAHEHTGSVGTGWNSSESTEVASTSVGSIGVVLGATIDLAAAGIDRGALSTTPVLPILAPGFGAQGARLSDIRSLFGDAASGTIVTVSRSLLASGPEGLGEAITRESAELATCLA